MMGVMMFLGVSIISRLGVTVRKLEHQLHFSLILHLWTLSPLHPLLCLSCVYSLMNPTSPLSYAYCSQFLNIGPPNDYRLIYFSSSSYVMVDLITNSPGHSGPDHPG